MFYSVSWITVLQRLVYFYCMCMGVFPTCMSASCACLVPWEPEERASIPGTGCELGTEPGSSGRVLGTPNC